MTESTPRARFTNGLRQMVCARPSSDVPKLLYLLKKLSVNFVTKGHGYGYFYGSHILDVFIGVLLVEHKILGGESLSESHKLNLQNVHSIQFTANCIDLKTQKKCFILHLTWL